jgi:hypothetical protein
MRTLMILMAVNLAMAGSTGAETQAKANDQAPCIGVISSTCALALRGNFGQEVITLEATSGQTGELASDAAQADRLHALAEGLGGVCRASSDVTTRTRYLPLWRMQRKVSGRYPGARQCCSLCSGWARRAFGPR